MAHTALEKIRAIEEEAAQKIAALKQEAVSEIVRRIAAAKQTLSELEAEYSALTGKDLKGEAAGGKRRRLSAEDKAGLAEAVRGLLKENTTGSKLGDLVAATGHSAGAIRDALKSLGKAVSVTGAKASTRYFAK